MPRKNLKFDLNIENEPMDTFIETKNMNKGFIVVNGFNIGRYFHSAGPQKTLYIPAPLLKKGKNEIVVFETDVCAKPYIELTDTPKL